MGKRPLDIAFATSSSIVQQDSISVCQELETSTIEIASSGAAVECNHKWSRIIDTCDESYVQACTITQSNSVKLASHGLSNTKYVMLAQD